MLLDGNISFASNDVVDIDINKAIGKKGTADRAKKKTPVRTDQFTLGIADT